jgi:hypothetical protein
MGRIRSIKPEFFRHEELYEAEKKAGLPLRVAFAGLFTVADREGRFKWKPNTLKMDVLPWDDVDMNAVLLALREFGFLKQYIVDGKTYGWIPSFKDHQVINNREVKSSLPEYRPENDATFHASFTRDDAASGEGKGREGKGREHIQQLLENVCEIFGRKYEPDPQNIPPTLVTWYKTILQQVDKLLATWDTETAAKQVRAYIKHCNDTNRKRIGHAYKVAETILETDWLGLSAGGQSPPRADPYEDARANLQLWTKPAWEKHYDHRLKTDNDFRKAFGYEELRNGSAVGSHAKSRQSAQ